MAKGLKTGGRKKGTPNHASQARAAAIAASGLTPLEYMLQVMRRAPTPDMEAKEFVAACITRLDAAKAAAPYVHPRLANIELSGNKDKPLNVRILRFDPAEPVGAQALPDASVASAGTGLPPRRTGVAPSKR